MLAAWQGTRQEREYVLSDRFVNELSSWNLSFPRRKNGVMSGRKRFFKQQTVVERSSFIVTIPNYFTEINHCEHLGTVSFPFISSFHMHINKI